MWEPVWPSLPGARLLGVDLRGHGGSEASAPPYGFGALVSDVERTLEDHGLTGAVVVGHGLGGMVALALAAKRLDLVRALVLSGTASKLGTTARWEAHIAKVTAEGLRAALPETQAKWFSRHQKGAQLADVWKQRFLDMSEAGYLGAAAAIAGTDLMSPTSGLRLPTLGIICSDDGVTPSDLCRETLALIPGAEIRLIRKCGHLASLEQPAEFAAALSEFLHAIGHTAGNSPGCE